MEGINSKRIQFFKDKIKNRLVELKPYMSDVKYRMYMSVINDCKDLEELREMVEMDMQFNMVRYLNELTDKIKLSDTSIDELEAVINQNARAARLTVIVPKKKDTTPIYEEVAQNMDELLEDKEVLEASANILWQRLNSPVPPELEVDSLSEEDDSIGLDDITIDENDIDPYDDAALEELDEEQEDEPEDEEGQDIDPYDDAALEELNEEDELDDIDVDDLESDDELDDFESEYDLDTEFDDIDDLDSEESDDDDTESDDDDTESDDEQEDEIPIDFGLTEEQSKKLIEEERNKSDVPDDLDLLNIDDMFGDEDEEEDDNLDGLDDITEDMFESDEYDDSEEEEEDDLDLDIDDMYGDEDDEEEYEEEPEDDELDLDDMYGDDEDEEEEEPEDDGDDLDSLDPNDIFGGDDEDEEEEGPEDEDDINIDDMYGDEDEDEFDISESDLDGGIEEDTSSSVGDFDKLFDTAPKTIPTPVKREKTQDKIFINGTQRGKQTQDMFNMIFGFTNKISKMKGNLRR